MVSPDSIGGAMLPAPVTTERVFAVEKARPPTTAMARGFCISPPAPRPTALLASGAGALRIRPDDGGGGARVAATSSHFCQARHSHLVRIQTPSRGAMQPSA